ncbi:MAG TPA: ABC transporter ATP-binding protein [Anaerolineaceae bacterium]|nr:ABC transporter ATP-binding protein [Anaerolineaceae bacterium]
MTELSNAFEMCGIVKRFPGVLANDHVDFSCQVGEVHALLGENGAGKSTLMNILAGLYRPEAGDIFIGGKRVVIRSPQEAIALGIGMVHQHFMLVPSHTVAENMVLGLDQPRFFLNLSKIEDQVAELGKQYGLNIDPQAKIWELSVGEQQRVEVLKMLFRGAKILIMDEPTAVLTPQEVESLFKTLRDMTGRGHTIVFISHKLEEVVTIADRVTVLRRGKVSAANVSAKGTTKAQLAKLMVGREVLFQIDKKPAQPAEIVLDVDGLCADNDRGLPAVREVSLEVRAGEILGIAGVAGNGQRELAECLTGLRTIKSGEIKIGDAVIDGKTHWRELRWQVAHIPEDRSEVGSVPALSIAENLILKAFSRPPISTGLSINKAAVRKNAIQLVKEYQIATPTVETPVRMLSGGNLQKVILARETSKRPELMIAVHPTRGLDIGATEGVHKLLISQRDAGAAILLISEDLDELLSLSDRIAIIYEGKIVGETSTEGADIQKIGLQMAGVKAEA